MQDLISGIVLCFDFRLIATRYCDDGTIEQGECDNWNQLGESWCTNPTTLEWNPRLWLQVFIKPRQSVFQTIEMHSHVSLFFFLCQYVFRIRKPSPKSTPCTQDSIDKEWQFGQHIQEAGFLCRPVWKCALQERKINVRIISLACIKRTTNVFGYTDLY